ncbi:MAG: M23 family metallopeptidase [Comamonas sp.]
MRAIHDHPKSISATLAAVLMTSGAAAFAVASLGPDAADLPVHEVLEAVTPQATALAPLSATDALPFTLYRTEAVRSGDSVDTLLARLGVADSTASAFMRGNATVRQQILGHAGRLVQAETDDHNRLTRLTVRYVNDDSGNFKRLVITPQARPATGVAASRVFGSRIESAPLVATERIGSFTIDSTLFAAVDAARLPDSLTSQIAEIFGNKIDFHNDLRHGDRFSLVYEALEADGEPMSTGRILSAEMVHQGKTYNAIWFQPNGADKGAYYTLAGESLQSSYLSRPLAFSRVTSGFSARFHPVLHTWKAHTGVDFGAPTGTPIRTVGDGVVEFAGVQSGYGKVVFIKHNESQTTVYAHMSRIKVTEGQRVAQGTTIGLVGSTGWATGPHLHFELRVNGEFKDPLDIARYSQARKLAAADRPAFERQVAMARVNLAAATTLQTASAQ